jgi:hypothetical protein
VEKITITIKHEGDKCSEKCDFFSSPSEYTDNRCRCELFGIVINRRTKERNKYCKYMVISELERKSQ